ncbi:MAG TPA: DUF4845 domain-containing protein [Pseudomonadales bacterium]|nr:DUF4845 domain-containing protein [Pseudomonadales bacterium]
MSLHKQRGASMYSILIIGALVIYFAITAIKIGPAYLDDYQVKRVLENAAKEYSDGNVTKSQIRDSIGKGFDVNNINGINTKDVAVEEERGTVMLSLDYEVRIAMFYNIDAIVKFSHRVPVTKSN